MKNFWTFFCILEVIFLSGCESQPFPSYTPQITGDIVSRDIIAESLLKNGSQVLFNATGGTTINNQVFTLNEGVWKNEEGGSISINTSAETTLAAIYPAYSGEELITHNPYAADTLQDILIAQRTFTGTTDIQLQFQHLFSLLNVHVHSSIASSVDAVELTCPKVTGIDPHDGTFTHESTHTIRQVKDNSKVYSFIVPSISDCPLTLTFTLNTEETRTHTFTHTFERGHKYECHVNRPGIRNAADLIEFYTLISCPYNYKGTKTLDDFGEKKEDKTTYRLLADIALTENQSNKLNSIGNNQYPFDDIFDGGGHTISNLKIRAYDGHAGLFGFISENGYVKNLRLDNCYSQTITSSSGSGAGILAGICQGTIDNCRVSNSSISNEDDSTTGAIAGLTSGKIINCSVENTTIIATENALGSITGYLYGGEILNCYASHNTIENKTKCQNARGGIAGGSTNGDIQNCFVYNNSYDSRKNKKGQFIGTASNTILKNCYYDMSKSTFALIKEKTKCTTSPNYKYDSGFHYGGIHISKLLNQWIGEQSIYRRWATADDGSPCFE